MDLLDLEQTKDCLQLVLDNINLTGINDDSDINISISNEVINEQINIIKYFIKQVKDLEKEIIFKCKKLDESNEVIFYLSDCLFFSEIFKDFSPNFYEKFSEEINTLFTEEEKQIEYYHKEKEFSCPLKTIIKKPKKLYEFLFQLKNIIEKKEQLSFKFITIVQEKIYVISI